MHYCVALIQDQTYFYQSNIVLSLLLAVPFKVFHIQSQSQSPLGTNLVHLAKFRVCVYSEAFAKQRYINFLDGWLAEGGVACFMTV